MSSFTTHSTETAASLLDPAILGPAATGNVTVSTIAPLPGIIAPTSTVYIADTVTYITGTNTVNDVPTPFSQRIDIGTPTATSSNESSTETTPSSTSSQSQSTATTSASRQPATPTASATETPRVESSKSNDGFSTGALAGAVVGSIIGTALITLLFAFLFFRRRRSSPAPIELENTSGPSTKSGAIIASTSTSPTEGSDGLFSLAAIIPHPADDETVRSKILTLFDHASLHVDSYYAPTSHANLSQDAIARLAKYNSDFLPAPLVTILGQRGIQRQAITHVLVYILVQAISARGELLPKLLAAQPKDSNSNASTHNAFFAWRMITAHLYNQNSSSTDPASLAARNQAAQALATEFSKDFSAFALPSFTENDRVAHLTKLANLAADLGTWLFAQPCLFDFVWDRSARAITVVPKVVKTFDEHGVRLMRGQVVIEGTQVEYGN